VERSSDGASETVASCPFVVMTLGVIVWAEPAASTVTHAIGEWVTVMPACGNARA
jgi:hypothetical protein